MVLVGYESGSKYVYLQEGGGHVDECEGVELRRDFTAEEGFRKGLVGLGTSREGRNGIRRGRSRNFTLQR